MVEFDTTQTTDNLIVGGLIFVTGYALYTIIRWTDTLGGSIDDAIDDHWYSFREMRYDARRFWNWVVN